MTRSVFQLSALYSVLGRKRTRLLVALLVLVAIVTLAIGPSAAAQDRAPDGQQERQPGKHVIEERGETPRSSKQAVAAAASCGTMNWSTGEMEGTSPMDVSFTTTPGGGWSGFTVQVTWGDGPSQTVPGGGSYSHEYVHNPFAGQPNIYSLNRKATWTQDDGEGGTIQCESTAPTRTVKVYKLEPVMAVTPVGNLNYVDGTTRIFLKSNSVPLHLIQRHQWAVNNLGKKEGQSVFYDIPCPPFVNAVRADVNLTVTSVDGNTSDPRRQGHNIKCPQYDERFVRLGKAAERELRDVLAKIKGPEDITKKRLDIIARDLTVLWGHQYLITYRQVRPVLDAVEPLLILAAPEGIAAKEGSVIFMRVAGALKLKRAA